jgi:hypothetical protein
VWRGLCETGADGEFSRTQMGTAKLEKSQDSRLYLTVTTVSHAPAQLPARIVSAVDGFCITSTKQKLSEMIDHKVGRQTTIIDTIDYKSTLLFSFSG